MPNFFSKFPKVNVRYSNESKNRVSYTDIYRFVDVNDVLIDQFINYDFYEIGDNERPDNVSQNLYNTPGFYWTFFIINERMKKGISEWPLSDQALDKFIGERYGKYGVCSVFPSFIASNTNDFLELNWTLDCMLSNYSFDLMDDIQYPIAINNLLNGLDLTYPYLRVKRSESSQGKNGFYGKIKYFDSEKYQLWLEDIKDPFFFSNIASNVPNYNQIEIIAINPFEENSIEWKNVNEQEKEWIESTKSWYSTLFGSVLVDDETYKNNLFNVLKFNVKNFYEDARLAPNHFINGVTGERLCFLYCNITGEGVPVPNFEHERNLNEEKRLIKVIKPSLIYRFADTYQKVLNSTGRLTT